ncbi:unnamed protein product, partial [marine sediment metagenome]
QYLSIGGAQVAHLEKVYQEGDFSALGIGT